MFVLACWVIGSLVGIAGWVALSEWVRWRHPAHWEARTGLPARKVEQRLEHRRRTGTDAWRTR